MDTITFVEAMTWVAFHKFIKPKGDGESVEKIIDALDRKRAAELLLRNVPNLAEQEEKDAKETIEKANAVAGFWNNAAITHAQHWLFQHARAGAITVYGHRKKPGSKDANPIPELIPPEFFHDSVAVKIHIIENATMPGDDRLSGEHNPEKWLTNKNTADQWHNLTVSKGAILDICPAPVVPQPDDPRITKIRDAALQRFREAHKAEKFKDARNGDWWTIDKVEQHILEHSGLPKEQLNAPFDAAEGVIPTFLDKLLKALIRALSKEDGFYVYQGTKEIDNRELKSAEFVILHTYTGASLMYAKSMSAERLNEPVLELSSTGTAVRTIRNPLLSKAQVEAMFPAAIPDVKPQGSKQRVNRKKDNFFKWLDAQDTDYSDYQACNLIGLGHGIRDVETIAKYLDLYRARQKPDFSESQ